MAVATVTDQAREIWVMGRRLVIPSDEAFEGGAFLESGELAEISRAMIERHPQYLGHLADAEICLLWKRSGGRFHKMPVMGHALQPSGLARHFAGVEWVIWFAADHLRDYEELTDQPLTPERLEALIFHEHCHLGADDEGNPTITDHDFEGFRAEVAAYGFWNERLDLMREAVQLRLFEDDDPSPRIDRVTGEIR